MATDFIMEKKVPLWTEVPNTFSISLILTCEHRMQFTYSTLNNREHRIAQQEKLGWTKDFHLMEPKVKEIGFHYYSFSLKGNFWASTRGFFLK